jgi:hypothetical protein
VDEWMRGRRWRASGRGCRRLHAVPASPAAVEE